MRKVEKNIIEIQEEVKIGNVILEKGDKIKLLDEVSSYDNLSKNGIKKAISKLKKAKASLQKSLQKSVSSPSKSEQDLVMKMSNLIYKADNKGFKNDKEMEEWSEKYAQIKDEVQNWT